MRRFLLILVIILVVRPGLSATGALADCVAQADGAICGRDEIIVEPGSTGGDGGGGSVASPGTPGMVSVSYPEEVNGPDGQVCVTSTTGKVPEANAGEEQAWAEQQRDYYLTNNPPCPGQPGAPAVSPRVLAMSFWQDIPLPKPAPSIAPGWAITGKIAFLETHGERQHGYSRDTPFGSLGLTATGRYDVDWGDGDTTGPYDIEGGPWPNGQITHTYINVGHYNVVVSEQWSSTWQLGNESGDLTGLQTAGAINGFRVEQVQAVVGPG